jgi:sugar lactone lactonase YvrE
LALMGSAAGVAQPTATVLLPAGVAYDAAGNLFVADAKRNQIFEVMLTGVTTVVAGTGEQGFGGDGGAAALALLNAPTSVAVAADGTIYIADTGNQRVRAVVGGQIQTVAGTGAKGFSGDGDARLAKLNMPVALAVDAGGGVLIADSGNHRVRRLFAGVVTTVAGTGVQGFGGDGAAATAALLDTPAGVAVTSDGRIFVADSHNHRIRVIAVDGTIATFAGSGERGFGGDGLAATRAALFLPRGVAVTPGGDVIFADSDNQRLRLVNAQGVISTIAGSGVQGSSAEGAVGTAAALDSPRGVAVSRFAAPVFGDAHNRVVREVALDANLYVLLGGASHAVVVSLNAATGFTYGQGTISASVSGAAPVAQGSVSLLDGGAVVSSATLTGATLMLPVDTLSAGQHTLTAAFEGDGLHGAAVSSAVMVSVAPLGVTATAKAATVSYGSAIPALTGTLLGVLPRDAGEVAVNFEFGAGDLAPVGTYTIGASLSGKASANYTVILGASSGTLQVVQAAPVVTMGTPQASYAGLPLTMTASVGPATRGVPTGSVTFVENGAVLGTGNIVGGVATAIYLSPAVGAHSISAAYGGDHNFVAKTSSAAAITVSAMPDFALAVSGSGSQTVQGGGIASYALQVLAQPGPFSGSVSMSVSGLPAGATVSFSPTAVVPGSTSAGVTMSIQTKALAMRSVTTDVRFAMLLLLGLAVPWARRRGRGRIVRSSLVVIVMGGVLFISGCGDRNFPTQTGTGQSFPLLVTATSTNLAGAVVTHTASVTLVVE